MGEGVTLSRWSKILAEEIFRDREGEGRPVSTIEASGALLARSLARSGIQATEDESLRMFISAFPDRWQMLRWFSGVDYPGDALVAFLILCCIAASEAAGSEANDYRERIREMMKWDAMVLDCAGLPKLWLRLQASLAAVSADRRLRRLILPDPRFRTQIGHAIELTFPSRQDVRRLKRDLDSGALTDDNHPVAVMRWMSARVSSYSSTFNETFRDFQTAWASGERALTDHRFWSGWRMVVASWSPSAVEDDFQIVSDEWGRYQLLTAGEEKASLRRFEAEASPGLRVLLKRGMPVLLREIDWGRWKWSGQGRAATRFASAALIHEKSHSSTFLTQFDRADVAGAPGWYFMTALDLLPGKAERLAVSDDDLIDLRFSGVPRIDGGRLARPSFPIVISTTGPVEDICLSGELAEQFEQRRAGPHEWILTPLTPVNGNIHVTAEAFHGRTERLVSLRASAMAPVWERELPKHFVVDEEPSPHWSPTSTDGSANRSFGDHDPNLACQPNQGLLDLVEYLAARPSGMPLGGFLELLGTFSSVGGRGKWTTLRALLEGGLINPLRVRGWRGSAVIARPPRSVLVPTRDKFRLTFDGVVNEIMAARVRAITGRSGLRAFLSGGVSAWAAPILSVEGDQQPLLELAAEVGVGCEFLLPSLDGHVRPAEARPNAEGSTHGLRQQLRTDDTKVVEDHGVQLIICRREKEDAPPVWLVQRSGCEPRYWTHRHLAMLDACRIADIAPFVIRDGLLSVTCPGVFLPLEVARWLRLATGVGSGPLGEGYAYALTPYVEPMLRNFLGLNEAILELPAVTWRNARRSRGAGLALARGNSVDVMQIWRWARDQRGGTI
jgi:hypothetical protein